MNNPIVSIIVPVYNTAKYLPRCLESLLNQTLVGVEIICINDGSTDNSEKVLKSYEKKDKRIVVINQKNGGSAAARNAGLKVAKGTYIGFIDSDDYAETNMYEVLVTEARNSSADVVVCGAHIYPEEPRAGQWLYDSLSPIRKIYDHYDAALCFSDVHTNNFLWRTLIRKKLIRDNKISFDNDLKLGEDKTFLCNIYPHAKRISVIPDKLYHYCWHREGSLMDVLAYTNKSKKLEEHCLLVERISEYIAEREISGEKKELVQWVIPFLYGDFIYQNRNNKIEFAKQIDNTIRKLNKFYIMPKLPKYMADDYSYLESFLQLEKENELVCSIIIYVDANSKYVNTMVENLEKIDDSKIEIILINNGVLGENYEYIKNLMMKNLNVRLYNTPKHMKRYEAVNTGIALADGQYMLFLDSYDKISSKENFLKCIRELQKEKADICVMKNNEGWFNQLNDYKHVLYCTKIIKEEKLLFEDATILSGKLFFEHVRHRNIKSITWEEKSIVFEEMCTMEWFGKIEAGKYLIALKKLVDLAIKYADNSLFKNTYKLLCSDFSKNLLQSEMIPNRDYYLDKNETSNQITIVSTLYNLIFNIDMETVKRIENFEIEDIYDVLYYVVGTRQTQLN